MNDDDRVQRVLADLHSFARTAARIVDRGREAYAAPDDDILRRAARSVILDVSAAVDRLPPSFTAAQPDVPWREIRATRSVIAHQYDAIRDDVIWETLRTGLPLLLRQLADDTG